MPETIKTAVPTFVENCTHIVAAHELRNAFPLTLVERKHRCVVYPGALSDIGGGYASNEQGRSNGLARVAIVQMLDEARAAGLKMMSLGNSKVEKALKTIKLLLTFEARTQQGKGYKPATGLHNTASQHLFSNYVHDSFEHFSATGGTLQTDLSDADYYKPRTLLAPTK